MVRANFRTVFTLLLIIILGGAGIWLGLQLPNLDGFFGIPSGKDLISSIRFFQVMVPIALGVIGLLLGFWIGPKGGNLVVRAGESLEAMSAADKIAVGAGVALGILVTLPFYQLLFQLKIPNFLKSGIFILISISLIYLGVRAMVSMKTELVSMLARGGGQPDKAPPEEANPMANCKILDTNVIIDGRVADVCRAGFIEGPLYIPGFVLEELQHIADSGDSLKRARGRRGLDILNGMQKELPLIVRSWDKFLDKAAMEDEVDTRLVKLAKTLEGSIVTNDYNLNKVAALQGVKVLNVNELANVLKPVVLPGEVMVVGIVKEGKEPNQGVAYLDDGTMIVVEDGRRYIGQTMGVIVTSVLQTVAGKMIFARVREEEGDTFDYDNRGPQYPRQDGGHNRQESGHNGYDTPQGGSNPSRRWTGKKVR